jgi:hypothetical protein
MKYDATINLGHVLTIVSILGGGLMAYSSVKETLATQDARISNIEVREAERVLSNRRISDRLDQMSEVLFQIKGRLEGVSEAAVEADRKARGG